MYKLEKALRAFASSSGGAACPRATRGQPQEGGTPNVFSSSLKHKQQSLLITFFHLTDYWCNPWGPLVPPECLPRGSGVTPNAFSSSLKHKQQSLLTTFFHLTDFWCDPPGPFWAPREPPGGHVMMPNTFLSSLKHM